MGEQTLAADMLRRARTIAVVGMSGMPHKDAHRIPAGLLAAGWRVLPVNPNAAAVLGVPAFARLQDIDEHIDLVDVFRPSAEAEGIARQAVAVDAGGLWLQLGIVSAAARRIATEAGLDYVEGTCIEVVRRRYGITPPAIDQRPG